MDTIVLVRYIMQDDPPQAAAATRLIHAFTAGAPGFVPVVVLAELAWVLDSCYGLSRRQVALALEGLLAAREIVVDRAAEAALALRRFRATSADFADCLIERTAAAAGSRRTVTFDRMAARDAGMVLLR